MKTYETYKDSGIEWIGEIPEHWKIKRGDLVFSLFKELIKNKEIKKLEKVFHYSIPSIQQYGKAQLEDSNTIESDKYIIEGNEILFSKLNPRKGTVIISESNDLPQIASTEFVILKPKTDDLNYLYYFLSFEGYKESISSLVQSATRSHQRANPNDIYKNKIALPPTKEEQTAIANYLDKKTAEIDQLIAKKEQLVRLYQEEKTAIINQGVTKGINPDVKLKDSGIEWLGNIPEHWEDIRLKYLGNFINGYSFKSTDFKSSGVRVLKISNIQHMSIDWSDESFIDEEFYDTKSDFRVLQNDLVFALTRPIISTGIKVALMDSDEKILLNQRNSIFRPKMKMTKWIYFILLSSRFVQEFDKQIDKTGQQPNISSNDIGEISIPVPTKEEQTEIVQHIEKESTIIDAKIAKAEKYINLLTEYRTALISEVVTGKIKVID